MWRLIPDGTNYNGKLMNPANLLFPRAYHAENKLSMDHDSVKIFKERSGAPYGQEFLWMEEPDGLPMSFEWIRNDKHGVPIEIRSGREPSTGYSNHFPIEALIKSSVKMTKTSFLLNNITGALYTPAEITSYFGKKWLQFAYHAYISWLK
jgi:hypothetical protein